MASNSFQCTPRTLAPDPALLDASHASMSCCYARVTANIPWSLLPFTVSRLKENHHNSSKMLTPTTLHQVAVEDRHQPSDFSTTCTDFWCAARFKHVLRLA